MNGDVRDMWHKWYEIGVALKIPTSDLDSLPEDSVEAKSKVNVTLSPPLHLSPSPFLPLFVPPHLSQSLTSFSSQHQLSAQYISHASTGYAWLVDS